MAISLKTHKLLWGKSGNRCAFPECRKELVESETETDDHSIIGEEAHIIAKKTDGPRGKSDLSSEDRDKYDNLILLCSNHHKLIDDQPNNFTIEKLKKIKDDHIEWINQNLTQEEEDKRYDDQVYATVIQKWVEMAQIDTWLIWTSYLFGVNPELELNTFERLNNLSDYLFKRFWPGRYPTIEAGFENFRVILNDLLRVFKKNATELEFEYEETKEKIKYYRTQAFYRPQKGEPYSEEQYKRLVTEWEYHVDLVQDLTLELTRSANYLLGEIRRKFYKGFRENEGILIVEIGFQGDLKLRRYRVEYDKGQMIRYTNLDFFMQERENRDYHIGKGVKNTY